MSAGADVAPARGLPRAGLLAYLGVATTVTALGALGALPRWPGLLHLVALPPLDLFADLRLLVTRAPSWPVFVLGAIAALGVRVTVLALLAGGRRRPAWRLAAGVYAFAGVPGAIAAQVGFMAHAALFSRLFWPGVVLTGVALLLLAALPWTGARRLGLAWGPAAAAGLRAAEVGAYAVAVVVLGVLTGLGPPWAGVAAVPVTAALTIAVAVRLRRPAPARGGVALGVTAITVLAGAVLLVVTRGTEPGVVETPRPGSLLVMSGINSASGEGAIFELDPSRLGFTCEQTHYYSYAGTGQGQPRGEAACPITTGAPYVERDTQRPFAEQVDFLVEQVEPLPAPVTLIAHSQAAWVAWQAAAEGRLPQVDHLVLLGPFPENPAGWPPASERGAGRVGGDVFRALEPAIHAAGFAFVVDAPLSRELLATPGAVRAVLDQPLPDDLAVLSVTASPDVALMPSDWRIDGVGNACPVREAHPYLPLTPALHREVNRFLDGLPPQGCPPWPDFVRAGARALAPPAPDR